MIGSKQRIEGLYERRAGALGGVMAFLLFVVTVGLATAPAHATEAPEDYGARAEAKAQALLKDLSSRRRVAKLFHNHQSMFQGVQERLVNTSSGNLTFLVRDLVAVGGMPIVAGRV